MSIAKNTLANVGGALVPLLVTILSVPVYLRLIGDERYGVLAVIWVLLGYFGFFDFGLGQATAQRMSQLDDGRKRGELLWTSLTLTFVLGLVGGCVIWLFSEWILTHVMTAGESMSKESLAAINWLFVALPLILLTSAMRGALQGREQFIAINSVGVVGDVLSQLLPLYVAWRGYTSIEYLLPAALCGRLVTSVLLFIQCRKYVPLSNRPAIDFAQLKPLLNYGGWSCVLSMTGPLLVTLDRLVIGSLSGAKAVAYYTVPYSLVTKMMIVSGSYAGALFPRLAALPPLEAKILADQSTRTLIAFMTPMIIVVLGMIQPFIIFWLGSDFAQHSAGVSELVLLGVWINSLVIPHHARLQAEGVLKNIFILYFFQLPVYFLMLWVGLKYFGLTGAAGAWSLRVVIDTVMLLMLAGALRATLLYALPSMMIVIMTGLIVLLLDVADPKRWLVLFVMVVLSIALHWSLLSQVVRMFFARKLRLP